MITPNTIKLIKHYLMPSVEIGAVPENEFQEILETLKGRRSGLPAFPSMMTREQAIKFLNVSESTLIRLDAENVLRPHKIPSPQGGREWVRYDAIEVLKFAGYSEHQIKGILEAQEAR